MKLNKFQSNKIKKQVTLVISICFVLLIMGIILYRTYSLFEESKNYNVIKGNVPDYLESYDVKVNFKLDGVAVNNVPVKDSGKAVESIHCDKEAKGIWNYKEWNFSVHNLKQTRTTCNVNFVTRYVEDNLNGTDPIVNGGLIPVTIDDNGTVKKADMKEKWYDYRNQWWANAVILENESIIYQNGEEIPEDNIESYFVWIPRYKYKIFDMGNYDSLTTVSNNKQQIIEIVFGTETTDDTSESCITPMKSGESGNCSVGKYMTHPAFISFDVNGIWVGKFETGYKGANSTTEAENNVNESDSVQIKPNVYSWRGINIANSYFSSYDYKRELDSHMMKNTEWGAVAYLQHSDYGSGKVSVRVNNNSAYITGYGGVYEPTTGMTGTNISCKTTPNACNEYGSTGLNESSDITKPWNTDSGYAASTTGNISGIYDMSGGAWEHVMGIMLSTNGQKCSGRSNLENSGFNGPYCNLGETETLTTGMDFPSDTKYYEVYTYSSTKNVVFNRRILGDATSEMGPFSTNAFSRQISSWYDDGAWFVDSFSPWFMRGELYNYGSVAGVFAFNDASGVSWANRGFRVVLAF